MKILFSTSLIAFILTAMNVKTIQTEIRIQAKPEKVWSILTHFEKYPQWNPFIRKLEGSVQEKKRIEVWIQSSERNTMHFRPLVLRFVKNHYFSWKGHLFFPGLFDGEHRFELTDLGDGVTLLRQSEVFSGLLIGLFNPDQTITRFKAMNEKVKLLSEESE